jgi:hypothetical protein
VIVQGDWKLMEFFEDGRLELYDLGKDLGETNNLADTEPEKARELLGQLKAWRAEIGAAMPTPNDPSSAPVKKEKGKGKGKKGGKKAAAE